MTTNEKGRFNGKASFVTGTATAIDREAALSDVQWKRNN
jgi:hypothetical protein